MASLPRDVAIAVRPGEHACCRFGAAEDRWRVASAVVRDGLRRGHRVICLCDRDDLDGFVAELAALDDAVEPAVESGQLEVRSSTAAYVPDGRFDVERTLASLTEERDRAIADGYDGLTLTGEVASALDAADGAEAFEEYERRLDEIDFPSAVRLCQYDLARFGAGRTSALACSHQVDLAPELAAIGRNGALAAARLRSGALRLAGELDFESASALADVLRAHFHGPLTLDLADLSYVDVSGMRALRGRSGQPLAIAGASETVRKLVGLLAWDTDPHVALVEAP